MNCDQITEGDLNGKRQSNIFFFNLNFGQTGELQHFILTVDGRRSLHIPLQFNFVTILIEELPYFLKSCISV